MTKPAKSANSTSKSRKKADSEESFISVEMIVELMATGADIDDLVRLYPHLDKDIIVMALKSYFSMSPHSP